GQRNLWDGVIDSIGSVANYYRSFGWQAGEPVIVPAAVEGEGYQALADQGIEPVLKIEQLRAAGVTPAQDLGERGAALLVLEAETGPQYVLGLNNFYVITRYNRSVNYAMSVYELAREIRLARNGATP
ncbi:MAG: lytic murein transglycosylase B, partial [Betaproteobacteria bacterium]